MSTTALSAGEQLDLTAAETIIEEGLAQFIEVGQALAEIRDRRLYRATHRTFEEYAHERWLLRRTRAYQLIDAAVVDTALSTIVDTPRPANEAQARELAPLKNDPGALTEVWGEIVEAHGNGITASKVREAVAQKVEPDLPSVPEKVAEVEVVDLVRRFVAGWERRSDLKSDLEQDFTYFVSTEMKIEDEIPDTIWEQCEPFLDALNKVTTYIGYDISEPHGFEGVIDAIELLSPVLPGSPVRREWLSYLKARVAEAQKVVEGLEDG
jgi:hypothetical protein